MGLKSFSQFRAENPLEANGSYLFEAEIVQTGTNAPVVTIIHNDFPEAPAATRVGEGNYALDFSGFGVSIDGNNTVVDINPPFAIESLNDAYNVTAYVNTDTVQILSYYVDFGVPSALPADGILGGFCLMTITVKHTPVS